MYEHFAQSIADDIKENNARGRPTKLILPVGPVGQYPILKDIVNNEGLSLKNCYFFFMDEYCDENGHVLPEEHPLSFRGTVKRLFFNHIKPELGLPFARRISSSLMENDSSSLRHQGSVTSRLKRL